MPLQRLLVRGLELGIAQEAADLISAEGGLDMRDS